MPDAIPADERPAKPLWRNLNFTLMWSSIAASGFGDRLIMLIAMTLMGATQSETGKTSIQAGVNFWFFAPYLLLGPPAGWLADTFPRKWILLGCDEVRAGILFAAFTLIGTAAELPIPPDQHWKVFGIIALVGCFAAMANPARNATIPEIVPLSQLQASNAFIVGIATIASLLGFIAGKQLDQENPNSAQNVLWMAIAFYGVSGTFFAFLRVRKRAEPPPKAAEDVGLLRAFGAIPYLRRHRRVLEMVLIDVLVWGAAFIVFNSFLAVGSILYDLDGDALWDKFNNLMIATGAGTLCGAGFVAWINTRRESAIIGLFGLLFAGVATLGMGINPWPALGLVLGFLIGFCGFITIICVMTLIQGVTPNYMRGRVMGIKLFANTTSNVLVNFIIWRMPNADLVIITALWVTGICLIAVAVWQLRKHMWLVPLPDHPANFFWHLNRIFMLVWHRVTWFDRHHVPMHGPVILASNHTAGVDPFLIQAAVQRRIRWVMLTKNFYKWLTPLWKTIDPIVMEAGDRNPFRQVRQVVTVLKEGGIVGIFPEGGLQRNHRELKPFQPGVGMIAARTGATIVPVWITGTPATQHMLWHFLKPSRSRVHFGKPYQVDTSLSHEQIVDDLRRRVTDLGRRIETSEARDPEQPQPTEPTSA